MMLFLRNCISVEFVWLVHMKQLEKIDNYIHLFKWAVFKSLLVRKPVVDKNIIQTHKGWNGCE